MARYSPFALALALAAAVPAAYGQAFFGCNMGGPTSMQAGQSITLSYTATNGGSSALTSSGMVSDGIIIAFQVNLVNPTNFAAVFPHIHLTNVHSSDPQLGHCFGYNMPSTQVAVECSNPALQAASIPPGAVETISATFSVDAGTPAAAAVVTGDIQQSANGLCNASQMLNIGSACNLVASAPPIVQSNQTYTVQWNAATPSPPFYSIDESTAPDFSASVNTQTPGFPMQTFQHTLTSTTVFYYRVRVGDCAGSGPGPYSPTIKVVVQAPPQPVSGPADGAVPLGSTTPVSIPILISAPSGKRALDIGFTASTDRPFITVTPQSGTLPAGGSTVLTVTGNPSNLAAGANTGTVVVTSSGSTIAAVPVSVSLVTPVTPGGKSAPPPNALILPVITHVNGAGVTFESDVRLTNGSTSDVNYQLTLTPTRSDGTQIGVQTVVPVAAGQTVAMNDIAKDFFGYGATGATNDQGFGSLQIVPLGGSTPLTFASSRTYATTPNGTFGQFVPVTPLSAFATRGQVLSLQHVADSAAFHTNLGLVEGSGTAATGRVRILDDGGNALQTVPFSLQPAEHQQINRYISTNGVSTLADGRLEVIVDSTGGAVTAYASVLDNITQDPYAVAPVQVSNVSATRYITPGVAELNNGAANFHSDLRIYNGGLTAQTVTLTYYPWGAPGSPVSANPIVIGAGQVAAIDNVLPSFFKVLGGGGLVLMTTAAPSSLVTTVRTYSNAATGGTYGQFIPGVSPAQGIGVGDRGLEILQLEQSAAFRSNVGVAELTGNPAHVRMTLVLPDSKVAPITEFDIAPNEFKQFGQIIASMNPGQANTYNARMIVEVTSGSGRVTAYGSVIDNRTQDPTYVPAQ